MTPWMFLVPPALAADPPEEVAPITEMPRVLTYVEAAYPPEAQAAHLEGTVGLAIELDEAGAIVQVEIVRPAGNGFDEAAVAAVRQMTFSPARTTEGPVPVIFEFDYGFTLAPEPPATTAPPEPPPVTLDGTLREMGTRKPVIGARVVVTGTELVATSDDAGAFSLRGVPGGHYTIRVLEPGHVTLEQPIDIVDGQVTSANLWLRAETYRENESVGVYRKAQQEVTRRTISMQEIRQVPGTFGDPVRVVQTLPGAARPPFGTGLLVIRGSNPEDSGVYIDGIRIPLIYHLTGTTSVLAPDLVSAVDYLPGNYGVQYGRTMGGTIDVTTKSTFAENKLMWGTDILDSQLYFEGNVGPKGKTHGLAVGVRRSYIDAFLPLFTAQDISIKPVYWDYQLKWVPPAAGPIDGSLFVYGFKDLLAVTTTEGQALGSDPSTQGGLETVYLSHRAVGKVNVDLGPKLDLHLTPSVGWDAGSFGTGGGFQLSNGNFVYELRGELPWRPSPAVEVIPGVDVIGGLWSFKFASPFRFTDLDDPLAERRPVELTGNGTATGPDTYLKINLRPMKDRDRLLISPGIRYNVLAIQAKGEITGTDDGVGPMHVITVPDPRLAARFEMIPDHFWVKGATGLFHQTPQPQEMLGIGTRPTTGFERAIANSIGFEHQATQAVSWELEVFDKRMDKLIIFADGWTGFGDVAFVNAGEGHSYGAELIVRHAKTGRFFGWISYTYSRSFRRDRPDDDWIPFDYDQPHIFSAQGGYDLPFDFSISAQVQAVSGNPESKFNAGVYDVDGDYYQPFRVGSQYAERLPGFFQTSLRIDRLWTFRKWQLSTYVDLLNAVKGVNPEFTTYNYDYSGSAYVRGLPFIPNIGVEARFYP